MSDVTSAAVAPTTPGRNRASAVWLRAQLIYLAAELARNAAYELPQLSTEDLRRRLLAIVEGRVG